MRRMIVFWDYSNFHVTLKMLSNDAFPTRARFDYKGFVEKLSVGLELVKVYLACSSNKDAEGPRRFFERLDWHPYFYVKVFETRDREGGGRVEKQADVYLASQMVALAYENAFDHAILISGDEDFVPALEIVHQKGKVITAVSASGSLSKALGSCADRVIRLDHEGDFNFQNYLTAA
jgi:uncharacterized LabA/DUF88 family protein